MFDEFISHGKLFYRDHKTCNFFNAIFHKKDFWKKGKRFCRDISIQWILMNIAVEIGSGTERKTFPMYANFAPANGWRQSVVPTCCCLATLPSSDIIHTLFFTVAKQHCGHLQRNIYIYIYFFFFFFFSLELPQLSSTRAPSARPNKFINLATLGPSALASRGIKLI